jgi:desulfoferrodoxin-like iron-binding protein
MPTPQQNLVGQVYHCLVCGAEVSVIRAGDGALAPRCCNRAMALLPQRHVLYVCPICGSEVMVLLQGPGDLAPRCCNRAMVARKAAA